MALGQGLAEGAPGVEAAGEGVLLVALAHEAQAAGPLVLLRAHVLDVHLGGRQGVGEGSPSLGPSPRPSLGPSLLTWQAFRLSLISTWLVWDPTHM